MWMFCAGLELEQINNVDESDLQIGEFFSQQCCRSQRFLCWDIARRSKHKIWFSALIITGPIPNTDALGAMSDSGINIQELQMFLLVGDNYIDVVLRAQAVICNREQTIGVRWQIDARHGRT